MNITILSIQLLPKTTATGKPYEVLDIAFKNNTFQGKVEGKQLMPFGANAGGFNVLKNATPGQTYEITVVKNEKGYNDWTQASEGGAAVPAAGNTTKASFAPTAVMGTPSASRGFPTPEERAATQVYIVRQSSLGHAVASLSVGGKAALNPQAVIDQAKVFEQYVMGIAEATPDASGFDTMSEDVPL